MGTEKSYFRIAEYFWWFWNFCTIFIYVVVKELKLAALPFVAFQNKSWNVEGGKFFEAASGFWKIKQKKKSLLKMEKIFFYNSWEFSRKGTFQALLRHRFDQAFLVLPIRGLKSSFFIWRQKLRGIRLMIRNSRLVSLYLMLLNCFWLMILYQLSWHGLIERSTVCFLS